jgi:hypothetical protein
LNTSVGPITETFLDLIGGVCPILGGDAASDLVSSSPFLNIAISHSHATRNEHSFVSSKNTPDHPGRHAPRLSQLTRA